MIAALPDWFKQEIPTAQDLENERRFLGRGVNTVCLEAKCPNRIKCFQDNQMTFMISGSICTRNCRFCAVSKSENRRLPLDKLDKTEPQRIAQIILDLKIVYAVITSVSRDDLSDGGAKHFSLTIQAIREKCPEVKIEVLIPDFQGKPGSLKTVIKTKPNVIGHNLETVGRLYRRLRPEADYNRSLAVLNYFKKLNSAIITKSALMLGLSETPEETIKTIKDLRLAGCDILILGQYLAPSARHEPVREFIPADKFSEYQKIALELGFKAVLAAPLARSSYLAEKVFQEAVYV